KRSVRDCPGLTGDRRRLLFSVGRYLAGRSGFLSRLLFSIGRYLAQRRSGFLSRLLFCIGRYLGRRRSGFLTRWADEWDDLPSTTRPRSREKRDCLGRFPSQFII